MDKVEQDSQTSPQLNLGFWLRSGIITLLLVGGGNTACPKSNEWLKPSDA